MNHKNDQCQNFFGFLRKATKVEFRCRGGLVEIGITEVDEIGIWEFQQREVKIFW